MFGEVTATMVILVYWCGMTIIMVKTTFQQYNDTYYNEIDVFSVKMVIIAVKLMY